MNPYEEINREPSSKGNPYLTLNDAPKLKAEDNPYAKINDVPKLNNASQVESNPYLKLNDATSEESSGPIHSIVGALREHIVNPLKETGNTVLDYLSYLDRPRNALAVGTKEYQRAQIDNVLKGSSPMASASAFFAGAKSGFMGDEYSSTKDLILSKDIQKEYPAMSGVLGFVGDVATDPLTYLGAPIGKAAMAGIKATGSALAKAAPSLADNGLLRAFNVYSGDLAKVRELEGEYRDLTGAARYNILRSSKEFRGRLDDLAFELNISREELNQKIIAQVEKPASGVEPRIATEAETLRTHNAAQLDLEKQLGIRIGEVENYFPHVATSEALRAIGKEKIYDLFRSSEMQHASTKARKIEGTIEEINAQKIYGTEKFFSDDPVVAQAVRDMRHANAVASAEFVNDVGAKFGETTLAPANFVEATGIPTLKGVKFDPDVAKYISKNYATINSPEEAVRFIDYYDRAQTWWKMWSLGARPSYHMRNMVGNMWNNYLADVKDPMVYKRAIEMEIMEQTGKFSGEMAGKPAQEVYQAALNHGVLGKGQYGNDIAEQVIRDTERQLTKFSPGNLLTPSSNNVILQAGFKAGSKLEENARLAHFIDRLEKGDSFETAAASVKKYLFDYGDLSDVERKVFKRIFPFWTWTRKNIPLQIEALIEHPERFQKINLLKNQLHAANEPPDKEGVPPNVQEAGPLYYGETPEGEPKAFTLAGYAPFMDLQKLTSTHTALLSMVSPYIKEPLEQMFNYDTFRNEAISKYEGQTVDFIGVKMPAWLAHVARNIVMINELDRANPFNVFGQNQIDPTTGQREKSPSFGLKEELGVGPFAIGTPRESRMDLTGNERALQYFTGLKSIPIDEEKGKAFHALQIKKDLETLKVYLRQAARKGKEREVQEVEGAIQNYVQKLEDNNQ